MTVWRSDRIFFVQDFQQTSIKVKGLIIEEIKGGFLIYTAESGYYMLIIRIFHVKHVIA